jgi:hypothetical protein
MIETREQYLRTIKWARRFRQQATNYSKEIAARRAAHCNNNFPDLLQVLADSTNSAAESLEAEAREYEQRMSST